MGQVPAATKALRVLRFLASQPEPTSIDRIMRACGLPRSTAYHLLTAMAEEGFVVHLADEHRWGLGVAAFEVGSGYTRQEPLQRIARRLLADLADTTGQSAHLAVLHGRDVLYVVEERAPGRPPLVTDVGVRLPAHLTASGRAILAGLPAAQVRALYPNADAFVDRHGTGPRTLSGLRTLLTDTRQRGFAIEEGEVTPGLASVAAGVLDHNGHPVAGVALTYADGDVSELAEAVRRTASTLARGRGRRLGGLVRAWRHRRKVVEQAGTREGAPMNRLISRAATAAALALVPAMLGQPSADAAPQDGCAGTFCATFDLVTFDAAAPTQPTTAAAQPTDLALHFADKTPSDTDKSTWLSKVSAVLGTSSSKAFAVTDPASLPVGSYVAGSTDSSGSCAQGMDGSGYATSCPAGHGSGLVELTPIIGSPEVKPATFGITGVTTGLGGAMSASISVWIPGVTVLAPLTTSSPLTYAPATATTGPTFTLGTTPAVSPIGYLGADFSMNTLDLDLNGLVGTTPFLRQSTLCAAVTSTLVAQARSTAVATSPFQQTVTGCPAGPSLVSVTPSPGDPKAFTFTVQPPSAAVAGRAAQVEWVYGDGSRAVTGPTTTHTYPTTNPVIALATVVDSAGARSNTLQVRISGGRLRVKQVAGNRLKGVLADQDTGNGVAGAQVDAYRCASRTTPVAQCDRIGTGATRADGSYRIRIPEVTKKFVALVAYAGTASRSATDPARFGAQRALTLLPHPDVTLHVSDKTVRPGATVRLTGRVEPGKKGKTVRLQGFLRGKWRSIGKATISPKGRYSTSYTVLAPKQDKVKVRALLPGTAATLEATSPVKVIRFIGG
jgi:DNA-binding IclR family transcriptional regulator